jgi:hypothetical protein
MIAPEKEKSERGNGDRPWFIQYRSLESALIKNGKPWSVPDSLPEPALMLAPLSHISILVLSFAR